MRLVAPRPALVALVLLLSPLRVVAIVSFSTTEQLEAVGVLSPQAITLADLNGDNIDDLITVTDPDAVAVFLNDGSGVLEEDATYDTIGETPVAVATGLFNDDNFRDIVVVNFTSGTVSVLLGLGDGLFDDVEDPRQFTVGATPIGIGVGDFNNDREDDLAVLSPSLVYILQGNGDGTFSAANPATVSTRSTGSYAIAVGLLDADTNLDYAVTNRSNAQVVTFFGNGNGTFTFGQFVPAGDSPTGIIIADADGDRDNDLMAVDSGAQVFDEVRLVRNNGGPDDDDLFGQPESIVSSEGPLAITALDVEPDGKVDITVTNVNMDAMSLLCQPSDKCNNPEGIPLEAGIFRQPEGSTIPGCTGEGGQVAVVSGKLNGDDMDDLVALMGDLDTLCISLNTSRTGPGETPGPASPTPTGPTRTPTPTRTLAPTATPTEIPIIGLGVCNTGTALPDLNLGRPVAVAAANFDFDGDTDVAVADSTGGRIVILLTTLNPVSMPGMPCGALGLQEGNTISVMGPKKLTSADLDVDGKADLAVIGAQGLSVFYGDGAGGFSPSAANPMPAGTDPSALAIIDFNRDSELDIPDIIVSDLGSENVSIFFGTRQRDQPFIGRCPMRVGLATNLVVAADLNVDTRADFVVTGPGAGIIGIFLQVTGAALACNSMAASFNAQDAAIPNEPVGMIAGVFTLTNNVPDLVVAMDVSGGSGTVLFYEGSATGDNGVAYQSGTAVPVPTPKGETMAAVPTDIGSGEIERDGRIDFVVTDRENDTLAEFRGQAVGGIGVPLETLSTLGVAPVDLEVVDIDGDDRDDVIVANEGDATTAGSVSYMISNQRAFTPTPVHTSTAAPTPSPPATATSPPTITLTATRTRRSTPSQTPESTNTQRGVVSLSGNGCSIAQGSSDSGALLLAGFGLLALVMRRRAQALLGG